jgi:murein DD-endopeptidase MepM/ murein hydrolase activator NlpD
MEGASPRLILSPDRPNLGKVTDISVTLSDEESGLRNVLVDIRQGSQTIVLVDENLPYGGFFGGTRRKTAEYKVSLDPESLGLTDGKATLRVRARDRSWRRWWHGNLTEIQKEVTIDMRPPGIEVVSRNHYLNQGGAGLVIYRLSEPCPSSGVKVEDDVFPGLPVDDGDAALHFAFFALAHDRGKGTRLSLFAVDTAGNTATAGFAHHIKNKTFDKDVIRIPDSFLSAKLPEFESDGGRIPGDRPIDKFLFINRSMRKANYDEVRRICSSTDARVHWQGTFSRLPRAAPKASFAEARDYIYGDEKVDEQIHMGIDLASVAQSPVPAANAGRVVYDDSLGIYGKTVIIDHGFGLFSMYAHLSSVEVSKGQSVGKDEIIGRTGTTGLAGGDHLHFGMIVHHTYVNPVEWWDGSWIKNNITDKIAAAEGS